jgi:hypothetical protein
MNSPESEKPLCVLDPEHCLGEDSRWLAQVVWVNESKENGKSPRAMLHFIDATEGVRVPDRSEIITLDSLALLTDRVVHTGDTYAWFCRAAGCSITFVPEVTQAQAEQDVYADLAEVTSIDELPDFEYRRCVSTLFGKLPVQGI